MRVLKIGLLPAVLLGVMSHIYAVPAVALELPDIHVLSGEAYPVTGEGSVFNGGAVVAELESEIGEKLTITGITMQTTLAELSSLGSDTLTFTGVQEPKSKVECRTPGDATGTVLFAGEYHLVLIKASPVTVGVLLLFNELTLECGKFKFKIKGPLLMKQEKVTSGTDVTEYGLVANCTAKGKQELKEYFNEENKLVKGVLSMNFGLGFETTCLRISKELVLKSNKMIDFLS